MVLGPAPAPAPAASSSSSQHRPEGCICSGAMVFCSVISRHLISIRKDGVERWGRVQVHVHQSDLAAALPLIPTVQGALPVVSIQCLVSTPTSGSRHGSTRKDVVSGQVQRRGTRGEEGRERGCKFRGPPKSTGGAGEGDERWHLVWERS